MLNTRMRVFLVRATSASSILSYPFATPMGGHCLGGVEDSRAGNTMMMSLSSLDADGDLDAGGKKPEDVKYM